MRKGFTFFTILLVGCAHATGDGPHWIDDDTTAGSAGSAGEGGSGGVQSSSAGGDASDGCTPDATNITQKCDCPGDTNATGPTGVQTCNKQEKGWSVCECADTVGSDELVTVVVTPDDQGFVRQCINPAHLICNGFCKSSYLSHF